MAYKVIAKPVDGSEASWKLSWKIVDKKESFQSADIVFEQTSAPVDFALRDAGLRLFLESPDRSRGKLQPADFGHPKAFEFLLDTLQATVSTGHLRAIKLVTPSEKGNIILADILPQRMQDIEYIEQTTAFAQPVQLFDGPEWTASTEFVALFKTSAGAIRLRDTYTIIDPALQVLESELHNRLPTPLVVSGLKRQTIVFVEGSDVLPYRGGCAAKFYTAAEALGIDVVVLAAKGHWLQDSDSEYAHWRKEFIPFEFGFDADCPSRIVAAVKQYDGHIDGILTCFDSYQVPVSEAAAERGLPTEPASAYEIATNKYKTSAFEGRNSFVATSAEEAMKIARTEDLPWPIIVKPCRGWGSELVFRVDNIEQL